MANNEFRKLLVWLKANGYEIDENNNLELENGEIIKIEHSSDIIYIKLTGNKLPFEYETFNHAKCVIIAQGCEGEFILY